MSIQQSGIHFTASPPSVSLTASCSYYSVSSHKTSDLSLNLEFSGRTALLMSQNVAFNNWKQVRSCFIYIHFKKALKCILLLKIIRLDGKHGNVDSNLTQVPAWKDGFGFTEMVEPSLTVAIRELHMDTFKDSIVMSKTLIDKPELAGQHLIPTSRTGEIGAVMETFQTAAEPVRNTFRFKSLYYRCK